MEKELYDKLVDRGRYFLELAKKDLENGKYDIGLFHVEQSLQLFIKAYLLKTYGDFPKTHDLFILFDLIENENVKKLIDEKWYILDILIDTYIGSRYLLREYRERELIEAIKFVEEVIRCLNI